MLPHSVPYSVPWPEPGVKGTEKATTTGVSDVKAHPWPHTAPRTVHDHEPERFVVSQQLAEGLRVELVVAQVQGRVDGLERFKVNVDFALFALVGEDLAHEQHEAVGRAPGVQLQALLSRRDGAKHGQAVDAGLDVGRRAVLIRQHLVHLRDLRLWRQNEGDHGRAVAATCTHTHMQR